MRPKIEFLSKQLIEQINDEAITILSELGVEIQNKSVIDLLNSHGARVEKNKSRAYFDKELIEKALKTSPSAFKLYDIYGNETNDFSDQKVHFTPGSAALYLLDYETNKSRKPNTEDYVKFVKIVAQINPVETHIS
jgi:trimethylamine--corrinoid protein Co-methyltransferase